MATRAGNRFQPDHVGFGLHIRSEVARGPAMFWGRKIAMRANATAPYEAVRNDKGQFASKRRRKSASTAHLKGSYHVRRDGNMRIGKYTRAVAVVESNVRHAAPIEFGGKGYRGRHILRNAGMQVVSASGVGSIGSVSKGDFF